MVSVSGSRPKAGLSVRRRSLKGLMGSERKHGLSKEQFPVSAYVGSSKNLKDLKVAEDRTS